jgi:hypothetical protein
MALPGYSDPPRWTSPLDDVPPAQDEPGPAFAGDPLGPADSGIVSAPRVDCWDCGEATPIDRDFCRHCGVWLQTNSSAAADRERPSTDPASPRLTLNEESFGPQPLAIGRRSTVSDRTLLGAGATILMAAIVGIAAVYTGLAPRDGDPLTAAPATTPAAAGASTGLALDIDEAAVRSAQDDASRALVAATVEVPLAEGLTIDEPSQTDVDALHTVDTLVDEPIPATEPTADEEPALLEPEAGVLAGDSPAEPGPLDSVDVFEPAEALPMDPAPVESVEVGRDPIDHIDLQPDPAPAGATSDQPDVAPDDDARPIDGPSAGGPDQRPSANWRNGWVCDGSLGLEDPTGQRWSVNRVSFLPRDGSERVVLSMERAGPDRGSPASVTAETFDADTLRERFPNVAPPSGGRNAIVLNLADGVRSPLSLRGYRPKGLDTLMEFSVFQSPNGSSKLVVGVAGEGCFRLRVPAWNSDNATQGVRQIQLDVKN